MASKIAGNIEITFFVPCYNEEKNISNTLDAINTACKNVSYEVLVVDDGSTDSTLRTIKSYIAINKQMNIKLILNKKNYGLGFSYFKHSISARGKYYMLVNGDNVEPVCTIRKIIKHRGKADLIIPYFDCNDKRNLARKFLSFVFTKIVNILSFTNIKYYNGPVLHLTENVKTFRSVTFGYGYQAELICKLISLKYTYINIPVANTDRQFGTTKAFSYKNFFSVANSLMIISINTLSTFLRKVFRYED
jgi:glycosyltransferase involved in cell wall biosynthesis